MKLECKLPIVFECSDYHEIQVIERYYKRLNNKIQVKEVAFAGNYFGMAYVGNINSETNTNMIDMLRKRMLNFGKV